MKKILGVIVGIIGGLILFVILLEIVCTIAGGYDSEKYHLFFSTYPLVQPGLWVYSYFIASIFAGYIAGGNGVIIGFFTILPILIFSISSFLQGMKIGLIELVAGGYGSVIFLFMGLISVGILGGYLGAELKSGILNKIKAQHLLTTFLLTNFLLIILIFRISFINFFLTAVIALFIAWFLSTAIISFPPIYQRFNTKKSTPEWLTLLPANLRPKKNFVIDKLEELRKDLSVSNHIWATMIMGVPETTRKVQKQIYVNFKNKYPEVSEKEILKMVLISRIYSPPAPIDITEQEIDKAMENINSFEDLYSYIVSLDEKERLEENLLYTGISDIERHIDKILKQEEDL